MTRTTWKGEKETESCAGQLFIYLVGALAKGLKMVCNAGKLPTPVLGLYMDNLKVCWYPCCKKAL